MVKNLITAAAICCISLISACGLETYQSGDLPTQTRINSIGPKQSKDKVIQLLGAPVYSDNEQNLLVYGKIRKKNQAFFDPKEFERDIYVFYFNDKNILTKKEHLTLNEARTVAFDSDETQTQRKELSVTEQLINNFGRYDAGGRDSTVRR